MKLIKMFCGILQVVRDILIPRQLYYRSVYRVSINSSGHEKTPLHKINLSYSSVPVLNVISANYYFLSNDCWTIHFLRYLFCAGHKGPTVNSATLILPLDVTTHREGFLFAWNYRELANSILTLYVTGLKVVSNPGAL